MTSFNCLCRAGTEDRLLAGPTGPGQVVTWLLTVASTPAMHKTEASALLVAAQMATCCVRLLPPFILDVSCCLLHAGQRHPADYTAGPDCNMQIADVPLHERQLQDAAGTKTDCQLCVASADTTEGTCTNGSSSCASHACSPTPVTIATAIQIATPSIHAFCSRSSLIAAPRTVET